MLKKRGGKKNKEELHDPLSVIIANKEMGELQARGKYKGLNALN